ncbi:MAG: hypothetical protein ACFFCD_11185 [Promethearchaeota archaeon]
MISPFAQKKLNETKQLLDELQPMLRPTTPPHLKDAYITTHKVYTTVVDLKGKYLSQIHETIKFIPELQALKAFLMNRDLRSDKSFFDEKFNEATQAVNRSKLRIDQIIEETSTTTGIEWLIYAVRFLIGAESFLEMSRLQNISSYRQIVDSYASVYCISLFNNFIEFAKTDQNGFHLRRKKQSLINIAHSLAKHVEAHASNMNLSQTLFQNREKEELRTDLVYIMLPSINGYLDEKAYFHAINASVDAYNKLIYVKTFSEKKSSTQIANENKIKQSQFFDLINTIQDEGNFWGILPIYSYEVAELKARTYFQANKLLASGVLASTVFIETLKQNLLDSESAVYYA